MQLIVSILHGKDCKHINQDLILKSKFSYFFLFNLQFCKIERLLCSLLGVCMEHGVLVAFYDTGISCWSAQTGEQLVEETCEDGVFLPFAKHVVVVLNKQVHVRHALEYLINATEDS